MKSMIKQDVSKFCNADGDGTAGEFTTGDNYSTHYAEILLAVDMSNAPTYYPYLALRIEPDRLGLIEFDGTTVKELDNAYAESEAGMWYDVRASFGANGAVTVTRISQTTGEKIVTLHGVSDVLDGLGGYTNTIGFSLGKDADYNFHAIEFANSADTITVHNEWDYDPFGRKIAQTTYDGNGTVTGQIRYVYDGARLVQEVDTLNSNAILADYVHGPGYVDDVIRSRRDLDADGDFLTSGDPDSAEYLYHFTDQQHSTIGLLDGTGTAVEYYSYDAFGFPTIYEDDGTTILSESAVGNDILYTGRTWLTDMNAYDYRQRIYDPAIGRFLTTDPAFDPANMGNPYTYVGNNPGSFVDPYGAEGTEPWSVGGGFRQYWSDAFGGGNYVAGPTYSAPDPAYADFAKTPETGILSGYFGRQLPGQDSRYASSIHRQLNQAVNVTLDQLQTYVGIAALPVAFGAGPLGGAALLIDGGNASVSLVRGDGTDAMLFATVGGVGGTLRKSYKVSMNLNGLKQEAHHIIPKFLGGNQQQFLAQIPQELHWQFHRDLAAALRKKGLPLPTNTNSTNWQIYFEKYPGSQADAFDAVLGTTQNFDRTHGTDMESYFWLNVIMENFK